MQQVLISAYRFEIACSAFISNCARNLSFLPVVDAAMCVDDNAYSTQPINVFSGVRVFDSDPSPLRVLKAMNLDGEST